MFPVVGHSVRRPDLLKPGKWHRPLQTTSEAQRSHGAWPVPQARVGAGLCQCLLPLPPHSLPFCWIRSCRRRYTHWREWVPVTSSLSRHSSNSRPIWWPSTEGTASSCRRRAVSKAEPSFSVSLPPSLPTFQLSQSTALLSVLWARHQLSIWEEAIFPAPGQPLPPDSSFLIYKRWYCIGSDEKLLVFLLFPRMHAYVYVCVYSGCFKIFFHLSLFFSNVHCDMPWCGFLCVFLLGVCWHSWSYGFIFFIKFENLHPLYLQRFLSVPILSLLLLGLRLYFTVFHQSLRLYFLSSLSFFLYMLPFQ